MISYKGDKFVKGKKFMLENEVVTFIKKSSKGYVVESSGAQKTVKDPKRLRDVKNER